MERGREGGRKGEREGRREGEKERKVEVGEIGHAQRELYVIRNTQELTTQG